MRTQEQIDTDGEIGRLIFVELDKHQRMRAVAELRPMMSTQAFWKLFGSVWTNSESLFENENYLVSIFYRGNNDYQGLMMDIDERKELGELPEHITIYRGCSRINQNGWSWTLNRDTAEFFAKRATSLQQTYILRGKVETKDIIAYFKGKGESEVVIDHDNIHYRDKFYIPSEEMSENREIFWAAQTGRLDTPWVIPNGKEGIYKKVLDRKVRDLSKYGLEWAVDSLRGKYENAIILPK